MRFDAPMMARAWLSVAHASASKDDLAVFSRTVALEEYVNGVRLVATDRRVLLTAWVPNLDTKTHREPELDEAPERTVIAHDGDGRGKGLLGYVLTIARRDKLDELPEGTLELKVTFDARLPAGQGGADETLEGLEPVYTILEIPDVERVYVPVVETAYPSWRTILVDHHPEEAKAIALDPELVDRVAKVRRTAEGPLVWRFGGSERPAMVDYPESDPHVTGVVMPRRWVLEGEKPEEDTDPLDEAAETYDPEDVIRDAARRLAESGVTVTVHPSRASNVVVGDFPQVLEDTPTATGENAPGPGPFTDENGDPT